jgi:hypothetical protein
MDKIQVEWVIQKAQYQKVEACLKHAQGFEEKEACALKSKFEILHSKLLPIRH